MKGLIIYRSARGSTKQFALWIAEETGWEALPDTHAGMRWKEAERVVIGASIHSGNLTLCRWIKKNWKELSKKDPLLFVTAGASREKAAEFTLNNLSRCLGPAIMEALPAFPVGGRYLPSSMRGIDGFLIRLVAAMTRDPDVKRGLLTDTDDVHRENLDPLLKRLGLRP